MKKMRNEWLTMPTLTKEKVFFKKKKSFHLASSLLLKELKLTQMIESKGLKKKYPKTWSQETYRFLWNMSR